MKVFLARFKVVPFIVVGIGLLILGLLSLNHIINTFWPLDVERLDLVRDTALGRADPTQLVTSADPVIILASLAAAMVTVTGLFLPLAYFLNALIGKGRSSGFLVVLRQAMWVGIWAAFCIWLQMHRSFGIGIAVLVAAVFIVVEFIFQLRSQAAEIAS